MQLRRGRAAVIARVKGEPRCDIRIAQVNISYPLRAMSLRRDTKLPNDSRA
jgi:hypothetical protein